MNAPAGIGHNGGPPLIVNGPAPRIIPVVPLFDLVREGRQLFVTTRTIYLRTLHGWVRIPAGYVTDFGSIPGLATLLTLLRLQPLGRHAWAALAHDWGYAIGEPGMRRIFDDIFLDRMRLDGVMAVRRQVMHRAVRAGGGGGYRRAPSWWETANFADPETGAYPVAPPFAREAAFARQPWGLSADMDWREAA